MRNIFRLIGAYFIALSMTREEREKTTDVLVKFRDKLRNEPIAVKHFLRGK